MSKGIIDIEYNWILLAVKDCMDRKQKTPRLGLVVTKNVGLVVTLLQPTPTMLQPTPICFSKLLNGNYHSIT